MPGWLLSWWLRRQTNSNLSTASGLPLPTKERIAARIEERLRAASMAAIAPPEIAYQMVRSILMEAVTDRHAALAAGAKSSNDPAWLAAALVENWATARLAEIRGTVKRAAVEKIEAGLQSFIEGYYPNTGRNGS